MCGPSSSCTRRPSYTGTHTSTTDTTRMRLLHTTTLLAHSATKSTEKGSTLTTVTPRRVMEAQKNRLMHSCDCVERGGERAGEEGGTGREVC